MELLAPAGNLEKLETAFRFGADAVYCGAGSFSLRAAETAFALEELAAGTEFAHRLGRRVYMAMNIFPFDQDLDQMLAYAQEAEKIGIDAIIISDPGLVTLLRRRLGRVKLHLSTQANTTNSESARFWLDQGVDRIVMARELSLEQVKIIREQVPDLELEVFIHGAMCIAYSGRCLLSKVFNDRSANRGQCSQPCRWEYTLQEKHRNDRQTIIEDQRGTYLLNSRDLCMIEHIPALAAAGVDSLKIEGRMKSAYYVAVTTKAYRAALDRYRQDGPAAYCFNRQWLKELEKVSHRPFTTGFYLPEQADLTEEVNSSAYIRGYDFVGMVQEHKLAVNHFTVKARNRFFAGDYLEVIDPEYADPIGFTVGTLINTQTDESISAAHNSYVVKVVPLEPLSVQLSPHAIIRRQCSEPDLRS